METANDLRPYPDRFIFLCPARTTENRDYFCQKSRCRDKPNLAKSRLKFRKSRHIRDKKSKNCGKFTVKNIVFAKLDFIFSLTIQFDRLMSHEDVNSSYDLTQADRSP